MKVRNDALTLPAWQLLAPQVAARLSGWVLTSAGRSPAGCGAACGSRSTCAAASRPTLGGLAVEAVVERLVDGSRGSCRIRVGMCARTSQRRRRLDRVRLVAGAAHRAVLAVAPQRAVRAFAPFLQHALVAACRRSPGSSGARCARRRSSWRWMSWLPWQSLQEGAASVRPDTNSARACTLER